MSQEPKLKFVETMPNPEGKSEFDRVHELILDGLTCWRTRFSYQELAKSYVGRWAKYFLMEWNVTYDEFDKVIDHFWASDLPAKPDNMPTPVQVADYIFLTLRGRSRHADLDPVEVEALPFGVRQDTPKAEIDPSKRQELDEILAKVPVLKELSQKAKQRVPAAYLNDPRLDSDSGMMGLGGLMPQAKKNQLPEVEPLATTQSEIDYQNRNLAYARESGISALQNNVMMWAKGRDDVEIVFSPERGDIESLRLATGSQPENNPSRRGETWQSPQVHDVVPGSPEDLAVNF